MTLYFILIKLTNVDITILKKSPPLTLTKSIMELSLI